MVTIIKPSDVTKRLVGTVWQNREKEIVAINILKLAQHQLGDDWKPFTWEDYASFCSHPPSYKEEVIIEEFAETGYLSKDCMTYNFTRKLVGVYMQYADD